MRKVHRVALAAFLKPATQALDPEFSPASTAWARAFAAERRFTFSAVWNTGRGFLIFEPSATATDDYFTLDLAWIRGATTAATEIGDELTIPELAPWRGHSALEVFARDRFRLRIDDLWTTSPSHYRGSFRFSTASSRYIEQLALTRSLTGKAREERAFQLLQDCMADEKNTTNAQAFSEVSTAAHVALRAVEEAALPAFRQADELARAAR